MTIRPNLSFCSQESQQKRVKLMTSKTLLPSILLSLHHIQCTLSKYVCSCKIVTHNFYFSNTFKVYLSHTANSSWKKEDTKKRLELMLIYCNCFKQVSPLDTICRYLYCLPRDMPEFIGKALCPKYSVSVFYISIQWLYETTRLLRSGSIACQFKILLSKTSQNFLSQLKKYFL